MKKIVFFIITILISIHLAGQEDVFDIKNKEIIRKNKIKAQTQWNHAYVAGVPAAEGYKNAYMTYDERGNLTEIITYKSDGKIFAMESYKFDERNYNTGYIRFDGGRNQIVFKKAFRYDDKGNKEMEVGFDGQSNYKNEYRYDNQDRLSEIIYSISDVLFQTRKFDYSGNLRTISILKADGTFDFKLTQQYDAKGNLLEDIEYQPDNKTIARKYIYKYNIAGKKIEEVKYEFGNFVYKKIYEYDNSGNLIKISQQEPAGNIFEINTYDYDAAGRLIKESYRKKANQDFSTKEYKYDEKGICIEVDCYYASYKYKVLFKYTYDFY